MEVEVLKENSEGIELRIIGEDHTFLNMLTTFLERNPKVDFAAYNIEHPLIGHPTLFFKLKSVKASKSKDMPVGDIKGVGPKTVKTLKSIGIDTAKQLLLSTPEKIAERTGIAPKLLEKYMAEASKSVPKDAFGYRSLLKEVLSEISNELGTIKESV